MPVDTPRQDYLALMPKWKRLRDCANGRDAILAAGNAYVPDLPGADAAGNKAYRERGNFYNAVLRTVQGLAGAIFQKAPELEFPETQQVLLDDITLSNVTFEMFALEAGIEVVKVGRFGVLVDMPDAPVAGERQVSGARPYIRAYKAEDIVNWRTSTINGKELLSFLVLRECVERVDPDDIFLTHVIEQYRVFELKGILCTYQLWQEERHGSKTYMKVGGEVALSRRGTGLAFIPFVFVGTTHSTPHLSHPPLVDLADINIGHWRNSVDHEYGLHQVALPTPWASGLKGSDTAPLKIGPTQVWELELQGSAGMLEFTGSGLAAIVAAMDEKKKQMAATGARLLEDSPQTQETASAVRMRHSGETASLKTIAGALEQSLTMVLQMLLWWLDTAADPTDIKTNVELNKEYLDVKASPQEMQVMLTALQAGEVSFETWYNFLATGGWAREAIDAEQERKDIEKDRALDPDPVVDPALSPGEIDPKTGKPIEPPKIDPKTGKPVEPAPSAAQ